MTKIDSPSSAAEVTAEWLTQVLEDNGYGCRIDEVKKQAVGTGQMGENVRFALAGDGDFPPSLVGKFASLDPVSKATGVGHGAYEREIFFYRNLQQTVDIQTPQILHLAMDASSQDFIILMEDLTPGEQGNQLSGCSLEQAELAMQQVAGLHGPMWGKGSAAIDGISGSDIIRTSSADGGKELQEIYQMLMPGFITRYANYLDEQEKALVQQLGDKIVSYVGGAGGALTLIHGDYRLDNMIFGGPYLLTVVDWQTAALGSGLTDVAYFAGTSLQVEDRQQHEQHLVRLYYDRLASYQTGLSFDDCWRLYRHFAPAGLIMAVIASMIVVETERGNDMFMAMAKRSVQMCLDLGTMDLSARG